jgi:hypothetical protein
VISNAGYGGSGMVSLGTIIEKVLQLWIEA